MNNRFPNWLIITGTNRNTGKTTLACSIIEKFAPSHEIIGVKISPHFHAIDASEKVIYQSSDLVLISEQNPSRKKDSSKMLNAGASQVFYLQTMDTSIALAFKILSQFIDKNALVVCESGGMRNIIWPGVFIVCTLAEANVKPSALYFLKIADYVSFFQNYTHSFNLEHLAVSNNSWLLKSQ